MKKCFALLIALITLSLSVTAQTKKVAVMETINMKGVSAFQSNMVRGGIAVAVANASGYESYDREAFDVLVKEQGFQRSSMLTDSDIRRLGKMAGVQYVLVTAASFDGSGVFIIAKLLDVETGQYGNAVNTFCDASGQEIYKASNELGTRLFGGGGGVSANTVGIERPTSRNQDFTETAFGINMRMIYVEGGSFTMGCTSEQGADCLENEKASRHTTVDSFYIGMIEVTQSQWEKVMGKSVPDHIKDLKMDNMMIVDEDYRDDGWGELGDTVYPSAFWPGKEHLISRYGSSYPMCSVDWFDAVEFCRRLSEKTGKNYSLPTEAQWEYAARGGKKNDSNKYAGSNNIEELSWYKGNSDKSVHQCGTRQPNALGLYDMSGNVCEWCKDYYAESYSSHDTYNPTGPREADSEMYPANVIRGGAWDSDKTDCRVSRRWEMTAQVFGDWLGFRVVMIP